MEKESISESNNTTEKKIELINETFIDYKLEIKKLQEEGIKERSKGNTMKFSALYDIQKQIFDSFEEALITKWVISTHNKKVVEVILYRKKELEIVLNGT